MSKQVGRTGRVGGLEYGPKARLKKSAKRTDRRWKSRSGQVVTRQVGDEKAAPPPPKKAQVKRQDKYL